MAAMLAGWRHWSIGRYFGKLCFSAETPSFQTALGHGIQPSLSVDVECNMTANMFSIMRATFTLQRALVNERSLAAEQNLPPLITCRQVIEMATIAGARAAHLDRKIGPLTPGKEADLLCWRPTASTFPH